MLQALIPAGAFLAKYATPLLATGGALMGGKAAYEASGGDIGATALGAGAGAFGLPALKGVASKARQAASEGLSGLTGSSISAANRVLQARGIDPNTVSLAERARMGSNVSRIASVLPTAAGAAVLGGGALLVPRLAGAVGSGGKNLASSVPQAVGLGRAATYSYDPNTGFPVYSSSAVPENLPGSANLLDQQNLIGPYQANLLYRRQLGDVELDQLKNQSQYIANITDVAKKREMERQLAAAKVRQELETGAALTLQGQRGAQALASQGMGAIGQALTANYQYG